MTNERSAAVVPQEREGQRLDQVLDMLLPGAGVRERRRAWETGAVLVDGRPRPKGYRVQAGQRVELRPADPGDGAGTGGAEVPPGVRVVGQNTGYMAAVYKPGRVHSEAVAGRPGPSVSACLGALWPGRFARLVNRLDFLTSGLLAVALSESAAEQYRRLEDAGRLTKVYAALVRGQVQAGLLCDGVIDAARRRTVRVLDQRDETGLRTTRVEPVAHDVGLDATLVRCIINKGARHQIRAHLAAAGHSVVGDPLYGEGVKGDTLYLHHLRLSMPEFEAAVLPDWPDWDRWGLTKADFRA